MGIEERFQAEIEKWQAAELKHGKFTYIDDPAEVKNIEINRIWTEFWRTDQFISNEYIKVDSFDGSISAYYVSELPYTEPEGSISLITTFWEDCEDCGAEDEDCETCQGAGTIPVDVN